MLALTLLFVVNYQIHLELGKEQLNLSGTAEIYPHEALCCCTTITTVPGLTSLVALG